MNLFLLVYFAGNLAVTVGPLEPRGITTLEQCGRVAQQVFNDFYKHRAAMNLRGDQIKVVCRYK